MFNPELKRLSWIHINRYRLVYAPLILIILMLAPVFNIPESNFRLSAVCAMSFVLIPALLLWGAIDAFRSVDGELKERTWEFQRLSVLSPWSMTWGKFAGSIWSTWVLVGLVSIPFIPLLATDRDGPSMVQSLCVALSSGVSFQALALLVACIGIPISRQHGARPTGSAVFVIIGLGVLPSVTNLLYRKGEISWFGLLAPPWLFIAVVALLLGAWCLGGSWAIISAELQERKKLWFWPLFIVFLYTFISGLTWGIPELEIVAMLAVSLFCYIGVEYQPLTVNSVTRTGNLVKSGEYLEALRSLPNWITTYLFLVIISSGSIVGLTILLVVSRDLMVWSGLKLTRSATSTRSATLYLAVVYALLPLVFLTIGPRFLMGAILPFRFVKDHLVVYPVTAALSVVPAGVYLLWKIKTLNKRG